MTYTQETNSQISQYLLWKSVSCVTNLFLLFSVVVCVAGKYGLQCTDECPPACKDKICDRTTGNCIGKVLPLSVKALSVCDNDLPFCMNFLSFCLTCNYVVTFCNSILMCFNTLLRLFGVTELLRACPEWQNVDSYS